MDTHKYDFDDNVKYYKSLVKQNKVLLVLILCIIVISIFISNFNIFINLINKEENKMSINFQDIESFNGQFTMYGGKQTGAQLKKLCEDLISSSDKYRESPFQPPTVIINDKYGAIHKAYYSEEESKDEIYDDELVKNYNDKINYIKNNLIINRHTYTINFEYSKSGLINRIIMDY